MTWFTGKLSFVLLVMGVRWRRTRSIDHVVRALHNLKFPQRDQINTSQDGLNRLLSFFRGFFCLADPGKKFNQGIN